MILEPGLLARSKAGRDKDCVYVIVSVEKEYVYLADGEKRTVHHAKRKNPRHVQVIADGIDGALTDENIKSTIRTYIDRQRRKL